jgi:predicted hydrocarbon binding protein
MTQTASAHIVGFPATILAAIHSAFAEERGALEAAEATRQLGFAAGSKFYEAFEGWVGASDTRDTGELDPEQFWDLFSRFFVEHGWGRLELQHLHPAVTSLTSSDWAEAERAEVTRHPACHLTTGLLAEMLGHVSGEDLAVMEVECRARGDAQCRFLLGGQNALERLFESLRTGRSLADGLAELG